MNGFYQIGYGTQAKGMGGVAVALPQETLVLATNPAALTFVGRRVDLGVDWLRLHGRATIADSQVAAVNGRFHSTEHLFFPEAGVNWCCGFASFGLAGYLVGAFDVDYGRCVPAFGTSRLHTQWHTYAVTPAASFRIAEGHAIGFGINFLFSCVKAQGLENVIARSVTPTDVTNRGHSSPFGTSFRVGYMAQFLKLINLGIAYQTRSWELHTSRYRGLIPDGNVNFPSSVIGGLAITVPTRMALGVDFGWSFWSELPTWHNSANTPVLVGKRTGPGLGWRNQFFAKVGALYEFNDCLIGRIGYNYGRAPMIGTEVNTNLLTLNPSEHHLTLGATFKLCKNELSIAYIHGFSHRVEGEVPHQIGGGRRAIRGDQNQISLSYGRKF